MGPLFITSTVSDLGSLSYKNQSIDLHSKSMDWFLYDRDLGREKVKPVFVSFGELERQIHVTSEKL